MPGVLACRSKLGSTQPRKGLNINGSIQMNIQTGILAVITRSGERWSVFGQYPRVFAVGDCNFNCLGQVVKDATVEGKGRQGRDC